MATCRQSRLGGFFGSKEEVSSLFFDKLKNSEPRKILVASDYVPNVTNVPNVPERK
jgi:hypothetical protein